MERIKFIAIVLVLFLSINNTFSQKTDLTLNLEKDKEYIHHLSSKSDIFQNYNGMEMNMEILIQSDISYTVDEIVNDNYTLSVKYTGMSMTMNTPMGASEFDSESENEEDIVSSILKEMVNKPFTIILSKTGKVVEVKELESMYSGVFDKLSSLPAQQQQQMESQIRQAYGKEAFKGNIEMVMSIFPGNEVAVGETWTEKTNIESGMSAVAISSYKLSEINPDYILITGESEIKSENDKFVDTNGIPVKYDLSGDVISKVKVDPDTRWIIEATVEQNIEGKIYIRPNQQVEEAMEVPMEVRNEILIEGR